MKDKIDEIFLHKADFWGAVDNDKTESIEITAEQYESAKKKLLALINQACNQAKIDELEIVRWAAVCADAPYIDENDRAGFNAVKEQVTNHIDDRIKELKELNNEL